MTTTTTRPVTVATNTGPLTIAARWRGDALAVHAPIRDGAATMARGVWTLTHWPTGLSAGTFRGALPDAVALARLWDRAFADALPDCIHDDERPGYAAARRPSLAANGRAVRPRTATAPSSSRQPSH